MTIVIAFGEQGFVYRDRARSGRPVRPTAGPPPYFFGTMIPIPVIPHWLAVGNVRTARNTR